MNYLSRRIPSFYQQVLLSDVTKQMLLSDVTKQVLLSDVTKQVLLSGITKQIFPLQSICYRMRKFSPCAISGLRFDVEIPGEDELQVSVVGAVIKCEGELPPQEPANKGTGLLLK